MTQTFFTSRGEQIQIGRELGRGGEGSVFEVPSSSNQVAKIYHQNKLPDSKKQEKLRFMVEASDTPLIKHISWPQETLHYSRGGSVVGFLMPNVSGKKPVHMVYSPAYRRQAYPNKSWEFLLCIARNIAASFDTLHSHQHIIGDVNENSIMVGDDAKVVLIDSDSFQINERGVLHLCEVGVPNYTAPELQNQSSFKGIHRTANHDNFGLALLIFHVLFGGRHPYAGIPLQDCVGESLDIDIKNLRYAYARDHTSRGFKPPPRSIPVSILPDEAEAMFHRAFTEEGKKGNRPTAKEWVTTLDAIRKNLKKCTTSPSMHIYPQHLAACPWCEIEKQGFVYFHDFLINFIGSSIEFNLGKVWSCIEDKYRLKLLHIPCKDDYISNNSPLFIFNNLLYTLFNYLFYIIIFFIVALFAASSKGSKIIFVLPLILAAFFVKKIIDTKDTRKEKRVSALREMEGEYSKLFFQLGKIEYDDKFSNLKKLRDEYKLLTDLEGKELNNLPSILKEKALKDFLSTQFIASARISGIGYAKMASLRSFGIETAADITWNKVIQVKGFGDKLTQTMVNWRASCERKFVFNSASAEATLEAEKKRINLKFAGRKRIIQYALERGVSEIQISHNAVNNKITLLKPQLEKAAKDLAQAEWDLSAFN